MYYKKVVEVFLKIDLGPLNYYIVHESLVTNNNHRTINQLREKFNHMKENWNDTNKWCWK